MIEKRIEYVVQYWSNSNNRGVSPLLEKGRDEWICWFTKKIKKDGLELKKNLTQSPNYGHLKFRVIKRIIFEEVVE